jgi:hypothetical protein
MGMSLLNSLLPMAPDRDTYRTGAKEVAEIQVETCTLDSFCEKNGIARVNVLKLDIQGAELKALTGASELLRSQRIDLLFLEVCFSQMYEGQTYLPELMQLLGGHGYRLYGLYDFAREINGTLGWCNTVFVSDQLYRGLKPDFWERSRR